MGEEPVRDPVRPLVVRPHELALRVVEVALIDRGSRELRDIGCGTHVVGMEVGDEDPRNLGAVEGRLPDLLGVR